MLTTLFHSRLEQGTLNIELEKILLKISQKKIDAYYRRKMKSLEQENELKTMYIKAGHICYAHIHYQEKNFGFVH